MGSALCTSGKTSHKDSFGLPRLRVLHHAAQRRLPNETIQPVCRQGYILRGVYGKAQVERGFAGEKFLDLFWKNS